MALKLLHGDILPAKSLCLLWLDAYWHGHDGEFLWVSVLLENFLPEIALKSN